MILVCCQSELDQHNCQLEICSDILQKIPLQSEVMSMTSHYSASDVYSYPFFALPQRFLQEIRLDDYDHSWPQLYPDQVLQSAECRLSSEHDSFR